MHVSAGGRATAEADIADHTRRTALSFSPRVRLAWMLSKRFISMLLLILPNASPAAPAARSFLPASAPSSSSNCCIPASLVAALVIASCFRLRIAAMARLRSKLRTGPATRYTSLSTTDTCSDAGGWRVGGIPMRLGSPVNAPRGPRSRSHRLGVKVAVRNAEIELAHHTGLDANRQA